ncbi:MAG: methyltransferase domain-containing protein [Candidatus Micrarchaeota archaeon]
MKATNSTGTADVYDKIADEWNEYKQKPLSAVNLLLPFATGIQCLDAGTGNGRNLPLLLDKFKTVLAIDNSEKLLEIAKQKYVGKGVNFQLADVCALPFDEDSFDTVLCAAVLHHLNDDEIVVAFNELHRVLKPGGLLLGCVWNKHQEKFKNVIGNEGSISWTMKNGEVAQRYIHFFEKEEIEQLAVSAGFEVVEIFYEKKAQKTLVRKGAKNLCFVLRKSKTKRCPICSGELNLVEDIHSEIDGRVFVERGLRCSNCSEEFISEKEGQKMIEVARELV